MRRFYAPPETATEEEFLLPDSEARHAIRVLRCRVGESIQVLDGAGQTIECEIAEATRSVLRVNVLSRVTTAKPTRRLVLMQGSVKAKAMDLIVEKATELGVSEIVPVISTNSVSVPNTEKSNSKVEKWRAQALAAIKQCGRVWLPEIASPKRFEQAIGTVGEAQNLVASLRDRPQSILSVSNSMDTDGCIRIWIGPEGDFTDAEYDQLDELGSINVRLSDAVLRSETAAICALSCLQSGR